MKIQRTINNHNIKQLLYEIKSVMGLDLYSVDGYLLTQDNDFDFEFNNNLNSGQIATLDTIISNHVPNDIVIGNTFATSLVEQITSSSDYVNKLTLNAYGLEDGNYKISYSAEVGQTSTSGGVTIQCLLDDVEIGNIGSEPNDINYYKSFCGFKIVNLSGDSVIKINWKRDQNKGAAKCRRATIEIIRVI